MLLLAALVSGAYHEKLQLTQLADGKVFALLQFTSSQTNITKNNFNLLPKSLAEIIQTFDVDEIHLQFTKGRWDQGRWGPVYPMAPMGVQLRAWLAQGKYQHLIKASILNGKALQTPWLERTTSLIA
jgi:phosphatidylinositol glycan class T